MKRFSALLLLFCVCLVFVSIPAQAAELPAADADYPVCTAVSCGDFHSLLLLSDGTVRGFGKNDLGQCNTQDWRDVVAVSAGSFHSVGLKKDGTVVAVGSNRENECRVADWKNIVKIAAGGSFTLGLDADGTVHATGTPRHNECDVDGVSGAVDIFAGIFNSFVLLDTGDFLVTGASQAGAEIAEGWKDVHTISCAEHHTLGLKADGTVVCSGDESYCKPWIEELANVTQVASGRYHAAYLLADGRVIPGGEDRYGGCMTDGWSDIVQIAAGSYHTLGLRADGKVLAAGQDKYGQCDVPAAWKLEEDHPVYAPGWMNYRNSAFTGQISGKGWPGGWIIWESNMNSTTLGRNVGEYTVDNWDGTVVSITRNARDQVDSINIVEYDNGTALYNHRYFSDGSINYTDFDRSIPVRYDKNGADGRITRQVLSIYGWTQPAAVSKSELREDMGLSVSFVRLTADEKEAGRLHYGTYSVTALNSDLEPEHLIDVEIQENGSWSVSCGGRSWGYDAWLRQGWRS